MSNTITRFYKTLLCFAISLLVFGPNADAQIRIVKVDPFTDEVTIKNFAPSGMQDISTYWFCTKITYAPLSTATVINGSLDLMGGAEVTLVVNTSSGLDNVASDLGLYFTNANFGLGTNMVDFMQYGDSFAVGGRENQAVSVNLWAAGTFILGDPAPWSYIGDGSQNGVNFWTSSTLGLRDEILNAGLSLYPNPVDNILNVKNLDNLSLKSAAIFDITGSLISKIDLSQSLAEKKISLNKLTSGIYFIEIRGQDGAVVSKKFLKL